MRVRLVVLVVLCAVAAAGPAVAQIYEWTDADGVVHLSTDPERIPPAFRGHVRELTSRSRSAEDASPPDQGTMLFSAGAPIIAEAWLNGVPLRLLVDTGASHTLISSSVLARAGIDVRTARRVNILGVTGAAEAREVVVARLDIAGEQIGPLPVIVWDQALDADGLLGRDVISRFTLTIDPARGRAVLSR